MLKNASLSILAKPSGNDTAFLWDLISPVYRFLLLNQTQISKLRQWNIKQQVEASQKNIKWSFLTKNVQSLLLKQKNQNTFVNLTFNDWGWVISSDLLANATLISLLTLKGQSILNNLTAEMASLNFNTALNITALKADPFENFQDSFTQALEFDSKKETAFVAIAGAISRATKVLGVK